MIIKSRVYRAKKLESVLTAKTRQTNGTTKGRIRVGYSAPYARFVHEAVGMVLAGVPRPSGIGTYWSPNGAQAKFLEQPTRQFAKDMGAFIVAQVRRKVPVLDAMLKAGQLLLRESKPLVPVEYGVLIASGYARVEEP